MMISKRTILISCLVLASPSLHDGFLPVRAMGPWPRSSGGWSSPPTHSAALASSYATVDPSHWMPLLIKAAGFFFDTKLEQLGNLLHCDQAQLNVVRRELVVHNFTVHDRNRNHNIPALRIGRLHVTWDSYSQPCLEVEVEDVDILVEFTNLFLTRNNWNELNDLGFPPELVYYNTTTTTTSSSSDSELIRIGSLDLQGRVSLQTRSRPLNKTILPDDLVLDLRSMRDLKYKIQALAEANDPKGCTSDQVYQVVRSLFGAKLKEALQYALEDIATNSSNSRVANHSKVLWSSAKAAVLSYASDLETHSVGKFKGKLLDKIQNTKNEEGDPGLSEEQVDQMVAENLAKLKVTASSVSSKVWTEMRGWLDAANTNRADPDEEEEDIIIFPDW
ncbi:expressed unknown protein [Seminavis robusta]|uniref:Uncharacterized protein n=1 Tax=Seminavis robusta TaxID=568900 RepID=A0A9N8HAS4_9STRA|nr:expressed unknown protein [Seminavis robusta]|eukprot:Sro331_g119070.1 n/a (390) ;mRNA; r:21163-22416